MATDASSVPLSNLSRLLLALLAVLGLACGCAATRGDGDGELRVFVERFLWTVNAADTEGFLACFAEEATAFLPSTGGRKVGTEELRRAVAPAFDAGPRATPAQLRDVVITRRGPMAVVSFDAGSATVAARRTLVLERQNERWLIIHLHASTAVPSPSGDAAPGPD